METSLATAAAPAAATTPRSTHRWWALSVLALAQFLVVLDASIVNIALPSVGTALGLDTAALAWVVTAYVLPFGGLLLLGGRLADRYGHRRVFLIGVAGFALGSPAVFFVNVPVGILVLVVIPFLITRDRIAVRERMDAAGAATATLGLAAAVAALSEGGTLGWTHPVVLGLAIAAVALLTAFV